MTNSHIFLQYGTLQFGKFEEIQKKGYQTAMEMLAKLKVEDRLPSLFIDGKDTPGSSKKKGQSARRNSIQSLLSQEWTWRTDCTVVNYYGSDHVYVVLTTWW